jgi:hypothetical protein
VYYKSILIWLLFLLNAVVTLDGILLSKSGTMTGGISGGMEARSQKWDDRAIEGIYWLYVSIIGGLLISNHAMLSLQV